MAIDKIEKKIETFLASDKHWPVIVDFSNRKDLKDFLYHFNVGNNILLSAGEFCGENNTMRFDELSNVIENNNDNLFLINISAYLKLYGEKVLKSTIKSLLSKSINGHVVIVTYQCKNYLKLADNRFAERGQVNVVEGNIDETPSICFITPDLQDAFPGAYKGFDKIGRAFESSTSGTVYIATDVKRQAFDTSLLNISQLNNGYEILCSKDARIKNVPESFGLPEQWNELVKTMGNNDITYVVEEEFGDASLLIDYIKKYPSYSESKQWLFYISLYIMGLNDNTYLSNALANSTNYKDFPRALFRTILAIDKSDDDFFRFYCERKEILKDYLKYLNEVVDFCKIVSSKQENAIYYLTDLTQPEKEKVIEWLDIYGHKYTTHQIVEILSVVYPDLAAYLTTYRFKSKLLNTYFEAYKYQKVINKVLPSFEVTVEEQANELGFVSALQPRTQLFDKIDLNGAITYFVDALGVEYLGYIQTKCNEYGLSANVTCGRSELPSLTSYNKDFVEVCQSKGCHVIDVKGLDEIKHHGEGSFDYEKNKTPIYLVKELEIIDELLKKIQVAVLNGTCEKAVIISDHGASRLVVLHETENIWQMETRGVHSGRCCPKNEINSKPDFAIEEEGYWVLANYDRFKGGRKANVEVHGGATLEEVAVPIIEITKKIENIEAFIVDSSKTITLAAMEVPKLKFYVGIVSTNIAVKIGDRYYDAVSTVDKYVYEVALPDCTKKGFYSAEILNGADVISSGNTFEIKKKGITEVSLFD